MENKSLRILAIFIIVGFVFIVNFAFFGVQGKIKDITLTSILGVEVSRCNDLTKEQLEQVFDYLVEKELE